MIIPADQGPSAASPLARRGTIVARSHTSPAVIVGPLVGGIGFVLLLVGSFFYLRRLRLRKCEPRYIPGRFLKMRWRNWYPGGRSYGQVPSRPGTSEPPARRTNNMTQEAVVDRHTSVRSIITLPSYSQVPKPEEQIVAREGERAGMDMVVEFPETAEEEEQRREEQMESLYQIRLLRRHEHQERERRRRERREARERGDFERLEELRNLRRHRPENEHNVLTSEMLLSLHQRRNQERRVASVAYARLGEVRHDGTRLRANSADSDSTPLLERVATMGTLPLERVTTMASGHHPHQHHHQHNASEASDLSRATTHSDQSDSAARHTTDPILESPPNYEYLEWGDAPAYVESGRDGQVPVRQEERQEHQEQQQQAQEQQQQQDVRAQNEAREQAERDAQDEVRQQEQQLAQEEQAQEQAEKQAHELAEKKALQQAQQHWSAVEQHPASQPANEPEQEKVTETPSRQPTPRPQVGLSIPAISVESATPSTTPAGSALPSPSPPASPTSL